MERLVARGGVDEVLEAVDADDFAAAKAVMKRVDLDPAATRRTGRSPSADGSGEAPRSLE